jgi:hypothetical protein
MPNPGGLKLGRKPGVSAIGSRFPLSDYLVGATPSFPIYNGDDDFTGSITDWGMLGNGPDPLVTNQGPGFEGVGDCGPAADYHKAMADAQTVGEAIPSVTGQVPNELVADYLTYDNGADNGVDLGQWLLYRTTHTLAGLPKIGGFAQIAVGGPPTSGNEQYQSCFHLFGGVYVGILVNQEMMNASLAGQIWNSTATDWIGGHCVIHLARNPQQGVCITWGMKQAFTWANWHATREEAYVIFTEEMMAAPDGVFHGVNVAQLKADIAALGGTL